MVKNDQKQSFYQGLANTAISLMKHLSAFFIYILAAFSVRIIAEHLFVSSEPITWAFKIVEQVLIFGGLLVVLGGVLNDLRIEIRPSKREK